MGALSMFENLPLGFRFKPTDVELIDHYLRLKINGKDDEVACIKEVDICRVEPWDLPDLSAIKTYDHEWFFFCPRDRKYPNGHRSNRATGAGYWKATGKDRTIKSRKMGLIGMKKTLVFYTGRAPKGQRTHWVIHEYRPTLQELDGTNPGQGPFVLCRLFKKADDIKPDENDDGSNIDEVETNVLSPNQPNISQEDARSELAVVQASPVSVEQTMKNSVVKPSDSITSDAMHDHSLSYSYDNTRHGSQVNEETAHEVDSRINEAVSFPAPCETDMYVNTAMKYYHDDLVKPQPLPQMHVNQGMVDMGSYFPADIGDGHTGFEFQDTDGRDPISDFLDSVLINPDDPLGLGYGTRGPALTERDMHNNAERVGWNKASMNESGSCSGSDVEVSQLQHDIAFNGCVTSHELKSEQPAQNYANTDDFDIFSDAALDRFCNLVPDAGEPLFGQNSFLKTADRNYNIENKIQLRSNNWRRELAPTNFAPQGTASRRLRLLVAEEKESGSTVTEGSCLSAESDERGFAEMDYFTVADADPICLAELNDNLVAADEGESRRNDGQVGTGIKITPRLRRTQPSSSSSVKQGTASRRLRLLKSSIESFNAEDDNAKPLAAEISHPPEVVDQTSCTNVSDEKLGLCRRSISVMSKCFGCRPVLFLRMIVVFMVAFLFMACIGLWKARNAVLFFS